LRRNVETCLHCGESFARHQKTLLINRTDGKNFHLSLFWGPNPRPNRLGGFFDNQVICSFSYVRNQVGAERSYLVLYIVDSTKTIDDGADLVAELLQKGEQLRGVYTLADGQQLIPGMPA